MDELTRYIVDYNSHLMTDDERVAHRSLMGESKVRNAKNIAMKEAL